MNQYPLVQVVMLTGDPNRRWMLPYAVESFRRQDYPNKELILVNWGEPANIPDVTEIRVPRSSVGSLRNIGLTHCHPEALVIQFDDDDVSGPKRILNQVRTWERNNYPAAVVLEHQLLVNTTDSQTRVIHADRWRTKGFPGSALIPRRTPIRYQDVNGNEDTLFIKDLQNLGHRVVGLDNDPRDFYRIVHGLNTCPPEHFDRMVNEFSDTPDRVQQIHADAVRWYIQNHGVHLDHPTTPDQVNEILDPLPWMRLYQIEWLASLNQQFKTVVEIGTLFGVGSCFFASLVHPYGGQVHTFDFVGASRYFPNAEDTLRRCGLRDYVTLHFGPHGSDQLREWPRACADLVYVDGAHVRPQVDLDLEQAHRITLPGGLIIVDDADHPKWGPSVLPAWNAAVTKFSLQEIPCPFENWRIGRKL